MSDAEREYAKTLEPSLWLCCFHSGYVAERDNEEMPPYQDERERLVWKYGWETSILDSKL